MLLSSAVPAVLILIARATIPESPPLARRQRPAPGSPGDPEENHRRGRNPGRHHRP
jgi:hypothetical protein